MVRKKAAAPNGAEPLVPDLNPQTAISNRGKALVFISHDTGDADLAEAFANLLQDVSGGTLKSFRPSDKKGSSGIEFGTEWYKAIMSQLSDATDVVALLTPRSLHRPWILYEAGVAKGKPRGGYNVMTFVESLKDKLPLIDETYDALSTYVHGDMWEQMSARKLSWFYDLKMDDNPIFTAYESEAIKLREVAFEDFDELLGVTKALRERYDKFSEEEKRNAH